MKRIILSWIVVLTIVTGAGFGYVYWQNSVSADKQNEQSKQKSEMISKTDEPAQVPESSAVAQSAAEQPGVFEDYQEGLVASTDGVTLLFFHAPWCPQCRMIEADINRQGVPNGVTILKVDYDSNQALRQKYNVTLQTTFVEIDQDGNEIEKFVAYNEPNFDSVKSNLLD